ncbi:MAG: GntR family transcriptional regulator [Candidatus Aenigmarchaeota archaeon]|nr:GntR family transcriptional regulator [Candidatus Aenigmarchaeota archaeon]
MRNERFHDIAATIARDVAAGTYSAGSRMPPVKQIARAIDAHPATVGRAYETLAMAGVICWGPAGYYVPTGDGENPAEPDFPRNKIREGIADGSYKFSIPPQATLARDYKVPLYRIRAAIDRLVSDGVIYEHDKALYVHPDGHKRELADVFAAEFPVLPTRSRFAAVSPALYQRVRRAGMLKELIPEASEANVASGRKGGSVKKKRAAAI